MPFLSLGSSYGCCSSFGEGTGPIHFAYPACNGLEYRLNDCVNQTASCSHYEDWSVYCRIGGSFELIDYIIQHNIELVLKTFLTAISSKGLQTILSLDGPKPLEVQLSHTQYGYAQVFYSGAWVPVADSRGTWGVANSKVVCRQLGYNG